MKSLLLILSATLLLFEPACKRRESAGFGGSANLKLIAKHHGLLIDSCTFYIKFNAKDKPDEYDVIRTTIHDASGSYAMLEGMKKGDYYIYGIGWDSTIQEVVMGGLPYEVTEEIDQDVIISVTE